MGRLVKARVEVVGDSSLKLSGQQVRPGQTVVVGGADRIEQIRQWPSVEIVEELQTHEPNDTEDTDEEGGGE